MPLIYITGAAGTGKSEIAKALQLRGFEAYDEDWPGTGSAHEKRSGKAVQIPPVEERDQDWFGRHEWRVLDSAFATMQEHAKERPVFLCGNSIKGDDAWRTFDKVFYLKLDEATLRQRIAARTDNDYGKSEE